MMTSRSLGPSISNDGANFRVRAPLAESVSLCLFDDPDSPLEAERRELEKSAGGVWQGAFADLRPGQVYGLRADGPFDPQHGHYFDPLKLLTDPCARRVCGSNLWHPDLSLEAQVDSAPVAPRSVLIDPAFDWREDRPPATPWSETVIYEAHVKGLTRRHSDVPEADRGTYLGLTHPAVLDHLESLGVTAVELLPVQQFFIERHLVERELTNYWGYNPLAFYAPHSAYAREDPVREFKEMVRRLHERGLEVLLDVVFNHTTEGGAGGPTLTFRGLDNAFYRTRPGSPGEYENWSGCGNSLDYSNPEAVDFTVDCLRYWVEEMHVDGFRFDLAVTLGRDSNGAFTPRAPFFEAIAAEPAFAGAKWIAEPWDVGPDGYQLGRFPQPWYEWDDRFRDAARAHWRESPPRARFRAPAGQGVSQRRIHFITSHDGFTLRDLTSYDDKHNQANGEGNLDGHPHELSRNWGEEGPTADSGISALRERARRGLMASLALAPGVPMILQGDEMGRTQLGNNNAYCQDNLISWVDWKISPRAERFLKFVRWLFRFRRRPGSR